MAMADITVRGAGVFGLAIAWSCLLRGASVQVIDPAGPGAGASGGIVGALAPHVPENWNDKKAFQLASGGRPDTGLCAHRAPATAQDGRHGTGRSARRRRQGPLAGARGLARRAGR